MVVAGVQTYFFYHFYFTHEAMEMVDVCMQAFRLQEKLKVIY